MFLPLEILVFKTQLFDGSLEEYNFLLHPLRCCFLVFDLLQRGVEQSLELQGLTLELRRFLGLLRRPELFLVNEAALLLQPGGILQQLVLHEGGLFPQLLRESAEAVDLVLLEMLSLKHLPEVLLYLDQVHTQLSVLVAKRFDFCLKVAYSRVAIFQKPDLLFKQILGFLGGLFVLAYSLAQGEDAGVLLFE